MDEEIELMLRELEQLNKDMETVKNYYDFFARGNTTSSRYKAIDEETEVSWVLRDYLRRQYTILGDARDSILSELSCLEERYLEQ